MSCHDDRYRSFPIFAAVRRPFSGGGQRSRLTIHTKAYEKLPIPTGDVRRRAAHPANHRPGPTPHGCGGQRAVAERLPRIGQHRLRPRSRLRACPLLRRGLRGVRTAGIRRRPKRFRNGRRLRSDRFRRRAGLRCPRRTVAHCGTLCGRPSAGRIRRSGRSPRGNSRTELSGGRLRGSREDKKSRIFHRGLAESKILLTFAPRYDTTVFDRGWCHSSVGRAKD